MNRFSAARPLGNLNMDVDTLTTLFKEDYTGPDETFSQGLEVCLQMLKDHGVRATFFIVGQDLKKESVCRTLGQLHAEGHEIASHSFHHPQGLPFFSREEKELELADTEAAIEKVTGKKPIGFRAPCWNIDAEMLSILAARGYRYDASVFPTFLSFPMKLAYLWMWRDRSWGRERGILLGSPLHMLAPRAPYRPSASSTWRRGESPVVELPVATTPGLRLPCFGSTLFQFGESAFWRMYGRIRRDGLPFMFQMHLTEWLDDQTENLRKHFRPGVHAHIPGALRIPLKPKLDIFRRLIDRMKADYELVTMAELAGTVS